LKRDTLRHYAAACDRTAPTCRTGSGGHAIADTERGGLDRRRGDAAGNGRDRGAGIRFADAAWYAGCEILRRARRTAPIAGVGGGLRACTRVDATAIAGVSLRRSGAIGQGRGVDRKFS